MLQAFHNTIAKAPTQDLESSVKLWMDTLPLVAFATSPSGGTLYVNEPYQAYTGLSAETLKDDGWTPLIHPEDCNQVLATWMSALVLQAAYEVDCRLRGADGAYRWFKTRAMPQRSADGSIEYWLGLCTDVHDLKMAEAAAHEPGEWLRLAQESSGVGTFEWDPITQELRWSAECNDLFGFPPEATVTDDQFISRIHPDDRAAVLAAIERTFDPAGPGEYRIVYRALWPDGTLRWVDARGRAIFEEVAGLRRAVRFIGTTMDVTAARAGEERLARQAHEFQSVTNAAPALIWLAAPDGAVRYVNDQWCRYTGQTTAEAAGNGWAQVLHPEDVNAVTAAWAEALATGTSYEIACRYRRSDGVYRRQLVRAVPMREAEGTVTGWVGTSMDIHDYARAAVDLCAFG